MKDRARFVTTSGLAEAFAVPRAVVEGWLIALGYCDAGGVSKRKAIKNRVCRTLKAGGSKVLTLWHRQRVVAILRAAGHVDEETQHARDGLIAAISDARSVMQWGEIMETMIATKVKEHGVEARVI